MNADIIKGKWTQIRGQLQEKWGKLTDDDLDRLEGHRDYLIGKVQEHYGIAQDKADAQVKEFELSLR